jgi:hypothetical protein
VSPSARSCIGYAGRTRSLRVRCAQALDRPLGEEKRWGGEAGGLHRGPGAEHYEEGVRGGAGLPMLRIVAANAASTAISRRVQSAVREVRAHMETNASRRSSPRANDTAAPAVGPGRKDGAHVLDTLQIRQRFSVSHLVRGCYRTVELRGLEPLTFSLRRHGVDLIRREHGVMTCRLQLQARSGCTAEAHMGYTAKAQPPPGAGDSRRATCEGVPLPRRA